jgi:hypothetical protein
MSAEDLMVRIDQARSELESARELITEAKGMLDISNNTSMPQELEKRHGGYAGGASDAIKALLETYSSADSGLTRSWQLLGDKFNTPFGEGSVKFFQFTEEQSNPTTVDALRQVIPDGSGDEWLLPIVPPIVEPSPINPAFNEVWEYIENRGLTRRSVEGLTVTMPTPSIPGDLLSSLSPFITEDGTKITVASASQGAYLGGERTEISAEATLIGIERELTLGSDGNTLQYGTSIGKGGSIAVYHGEDTDDDGQEEYGMKLPLRNFDVGLRLEPEAISQSIENLFDRYD